MDLMEAAEKGDASGVRNALKKYGSNLDGRQANDYRMALQRACQYGQTNVVQELLQVSTNWNKCDPARVNDADVLATQEYIYGSVSSGLGWIGNNILKVDMIWEKKIGVYITPQSISTV